MNKQLTLILLIVAFGTAAAQEAAKGHLSVQTVVQKEQVSTNDQGEAETVLVPADSVVPGENVIYTTTFRNVSEEPADNVVITNPIGAELTYVEGSAFGPGTAIEFSVDGGQTFAPSDELTITEDGTTRAAGVEDFTHIRWVMQQKLAVGAQGIVRFAAVLD